MEKTIVAAIAATLMTTSATAATVTGTIGIETTYADSAFTTTPSVDATIEQSDDLAGHFVDLNLETDLKTGVDVAGYTVGTTYNNFDLSFGNDADAFVVSGNGLHNPTQETGLVVSGLGVTTYLGGEGGSVSNVQAAGVAYGTTLAVDYNFDTKDFAYGAAYTLAGVTTSATYADSTLAYEFETEVMGVTTAVYGTEGDLFTGVTVGYTTDIAGNTLGAEVAFNDVTDKVTPTVSLTRKF